MLSLTSRVLALTFISSVLSAPVEYRDDNVSTLEKRQNITLKAPVVAEPSLHWEGLDGEWSTFAIRVGTPPQVVRVIPATSTSEIWVVAVERACWSKYGWSQGCEEGRGAAFRAANSSTWNSKGGFALGLNADLGYGAGAEEFGEYGYESVGFGYDNSSGPQRPDVIVAQIVSHTYWGGLLGLSPEPVNYTEFGDPQPSFTTKLKDEISSLSWSYTAGAKYRLKGIFGTLIYGGYDASRFEENDAIFTMTGDNLRDVVVTLKAIKATSGGQDTQLLAAPEFAYIDSAIPDLVLPTSVCQEFEKAFGIKLDEASGRYLLDEATHTSLKQKNPNITFTLANSKESERTINIVLPYAAFDLTLSKPLYNGTGNSSAYFPMRRAPTTGQYTLGRTFLQEAYVTADYNSRTFNVSQALFPDPLAPIIIAIPPDLGQPDENNEKPAGNGTDPEPGTPVDPDDKGGDLSTGAIVGIIVAAVLGGLLLVTLIFFCCPCGFCPALTIFGIAGGRARKRKSSRSSTPPVEIDGRRIGDPETTAYNQQASGMIGEVSGNDAKFEIAGNPIMHPQELEAEVPPEIVAAAAARRSHELEGDRPSQDEGQSSSGPNISSESRGDNQYLSSGSEGVSSVSGESPQSRSARLAEMHGTGTRPLNGPPDRLGRVDEVVSPVSPTPGRAHGFGERPRNMRINTDEAANMRAEQEQNSAAETDMTWTPKTPAQRRWNESDESEDIYEGDR